jgi:hypothetical protein
MGRRFSASRLGVAAVIVLVGLAPALAAGQATKGSTTGPRTPWGHPDLQGVWTNTTTTPFERPKELAGKQVLTADEQRELDRQTAARVSLDNVPRSNVGAYNEFWVERGKLSNQTSLVVDPPDGRIPPLTPDAQKQATARAQYRKEHPADSWEDIALYTRCVTRGLPGAMVPGFYNHNYQILQTPDHVAILVEMIHDARIIPLDGRRHVGSTLRQWMGDSRGRWEGNTLVVETTNFSPKAEFRNARENLRLIERFTRIDADTIDYRFTVEDPTTFTRPWTAAIPMTKLHEPLYEYACHEGNYAVPNILSGHRADEKAAGR